MRQGHMTEEYLLAVLTIVTSFFLVLILFVLPDVNGVGSHDQLMNTTKERVIKGAPQWFEKY